ncbi:MAG TPA: FHA domain-containing protein [Casimicrobiaceae bacterium]|nr:FHA domain-containing protein [Casimicrobiaceae bacterium]
MSKLVLFLADGRALDIKLDRERMTIGRRPDNDICLPYPAVSGEHAAIVTILDDSFLEDHGSTNGTLVNGRPITKHFLRDRDQIDVGRQRLVYVVDEAAVIDPPRALLANAGARDLEQKVGEVPKAVPMIHGTAVAHSGEASQPPAAPPRACRTEPVTTAVAAAPPPASPEVELARPVPTIKVLTGASAGRTVPLDKDETLVGRVGLQVAALRRTAQGIVLVPVDGERAPIVNGAPAGADGLPVRPGDVIEVAGARLELLPAGEAAPAPMQGTTRGA